MRANFVDIDDLDRLMDFETRLEYRGVRYGREKKDCKICDSNVTYHHYYVPDKRKCHGCYCRHSIKRFNNQNPSYVRTDCPLFNIPVMQMQTPHITENIPNQLTLQEFRPSVSTNPQPQTNQQVGGIRNQINSSRTPLPNICTSANTSNPSREHSPQLRISNYQTNQVQPPPRFQNVQSMFQDQRVPKKRKPNQMDERKKFEIISVVEDRGRLEGGEFRIIYFSFPIQNFMETMLYVDTAATVVNFGFRAAKLMANIALPTYSRVDLDQNSREAQLSDFYLPLFVPPGRRPGLVDVFFRLNNMECERLEGYRYLGDEEDQRSLKLTMIPSSDGISDSISSPGLPPDIEGLPPLPQYPYHQNGLIDEMSSSESSYDLFGRSILHYFAAQNKLVLLRKYIEEKGYDPFRVDVIGISPFDAAEYFGNQEICNYLKTWKTKKKKTTQEKDQNRGTVGESRIVSGNTRKKAFETEEVEGEVESEFEGGSNIHQMKCEDDMKMPFIPFEMLKIDEKTKLGGGGFGNVYLGTWNGHNVAIKKAQNNVGMNEDEFKKAVEIELRNEANTYNVLRSPNIANCYGYSRDKKDNMHLILEYEELGSLYDVLKAKRKKLDDQEKLQIAIDVALGLLHVHEKGFVHRDIKPANILIAVDFRAKICDFGMPVVSASGKRPNLTKPGGTGRYVAPEIRLSEDIYFKHTIQSDIYSYGITMKELFFGSKDMSIRGLSEKLYGVLPVFERCFEEQPKNRFRTLDKVVKLLESVMSRFDDISKRRVKSFDFARYDRRVAEVKKLKIENAGLKASIRNLQMTIKDFRDLRKKCEEQERNRRLADFEKLKNENKVLGDAVRKFKMKKRKLESQNLVSQVSSYFGFGTN